MVFYCSDCIHFNLSTINWMSLTFNIAQQRSGVFFINVSEKAGTVRHSRKYAGEAKKVLCPLLLCLRLPAYQHFLQYFKVDNTAGGACKIATPLKIPVFCLCGNLQALYCKHGLTREVIHDGQIPPQTLSCLGRMCSLRTIIRLS